METVLVWFGLGIAPSAIIVAVAPGMRGFWPRIVSAVLLIGINSLWISFLLPSLNRSSGFVPTDILAMVAGSFCGALLGLLIVSWSWWRAWRFRSRRGFPVITTSQSASDL